MIKRLLCIGLLFVQILYGQEPLPGKDLKVGVVLSGGGAKGLAHIAVLKELEMAGVRIDYIGGTSMGAVVGSLYASGYGADQLDSIFRTIDFYKLLTDELPRKAKPFYEKEVGEKYVLTLPIKNEKVGIPVAVSEGQNGLNLHTRLTQHVSNISDFSKLPIPFLCVATDLETGKQVLLTKGFLPMAVKASASFPTLLSPVEIDGKLLSDGGIVNNFPVEEVREMGADLIIGVDIQGSLYEKSSLDSAVKILNQIVGYQLYQTLDYKYDLVDVLIQPVMDSYHVVSFDKIDEIMEAGALAAQAKQDLLKSVASRQHSPSPRTIDPTQVPKFLINEVAIAGIENYTRPYILGKMNLRTRDSISYQKLIASIESLYGTGNFESVQYRIADKSGRNVLQMKLKERAVTSFFQLGLHYDGLYKTGILLNGLSKHLFLKNDVVSADLVLGDNVRYQFNYFIDNGFRWSVGLRSRYNRFSHDIRFDQQYPHKIDLRYEDFTNQLYFQTVFSRKYAFGVGLEHKNIKAFTESISPVDNQPAYSEEDRFYFDRSSYVNTHAYLKIDTYDRHYFQKKGLFLHVDLLYYIGSSDYNDNFSPFSQLKGKIGFAHTFFDQLTGHVISEAGITLGENENRSLDYNLGGYGEHFINNFNPFFGYDFAALSADAFLRSAFSLRYEVFPRHYLTAAANYARVESDLFNQGKIFENTKKGYLLGYGLDTFLGPMQVQYTWSPDHPDRYWHFNIGYWF